MKEVFILCIIFRASDEIKDEDLGPKISSVSGANRKRKWKEEEDEDEDQKEEEESTDVDTSSDDEDDNDEVNKTAEVVEAKETTTPCQKTEDKSREEEQKKTEQDEHSQKKISEQNKKLSEPAIFIPVDRSPEIQVGANCVFLSTKPHLFCANV